MSHNLKWKIEVVRKREPFERVEAQLKCTDRVMGPGNAAMLPLSGFEPATRSYEPAQVASRIHVQ
jgi:hypothetical protein